MRRSGKTKARRLLSSVEPAKPDCLLKEMRSRIPRSAAYVHAFESASVPYRIAAGLVCTCHTDQSTGTGYIRLANGKTDAASNGATDGYSIRVPDKVEAAASGRLISVNVIARAAGGALSRFAIAYSTNDTGNSGWRWQQAGAEWSVFTMEYDVPVMTRAHGDFVGILPDMEGRCGTEICYMAVNTPAGSENSGFPNDLFDQCWYADTYPDLKLSRDLPSKERDTRSIQHYMEVGARERRDPNVLFDSKWYAQRFKLPPDIDPLVHYVQHEKYEQVSPNQFWEVARKKSVIPPPPLSSVLHQYPAIRKPTYIVGLFGSGRLYIKDLIVNSGLEIAYYFRDGMHDYTGAVPVILSGHVTSMYKSAMCRPPDVGRRLFDRAAARLINLVFIYRHPLDSLLTNWAWFREYLRNQKMTSGIAGAYKSEEEFQRTLNDNIHEFFLFCGGSKDFARSLAGADVDWSFLSLLEFIHETEVFVSHPNVNCFRFEDFKSNPAKEFQRLVSIVAPDLSPESGKVFAPRSLTSRYQSATKERRLVPNHHCFFAESYYDAYQGHGIFNVDMSSDPDRGAARAGSSTTRVLT